MAAAALAGGGAAPASAHTEAEYVAVPAGDEVTVHFAPTHGCSGSPTTGVSVRVPAPGAAAGEVDGFTATAEADGERTVLRWTGGSIPADEEGEFPITFTVPDRVGELLLFPTVQTCAEGEIAWIDGDPEGEYPAVRILVLAAGSEAARSIDDVPADAPGRDQLTAIVDVDNPTASTTQPPATTAPVASSAVPPATTAAVVTTGAPVTTEPDATTIAGAPTTTLAAGATTAAPATTAAATPTTEVDEDDGSGAATAVFIGVIVVVVLGAGAGVLIARRNRERTG